MQTHSYTKDRIDYYLSRVGVSSVQDATYEQLKKMFLLLINAFKKEEIPLEFLCELASEMWQHPKEEDSYEMEELKEIIQGCSEINSYIRKIPEVDKDGQTTLGYLMDTLLYFEKNKSLIE